MEVVLTGRYEAADWMTDEGETKIVQPVIREIIQFVMSVMVLHTESCFDRLTGAFWNV